MEQVGKDAVASSCATPSPWCPSRRRRWWPPPSARSSPSPMPPVPASSGAAWPTASAPAPRGWPTCWRRPKRTCWPTWPSPPSTGGRAGRTPPWNGPSRQVTRRTHVVGLFPTAGAVVRLVGAVLVEQHDEWQVGRRYCSAASLTKLLTAEEVAPLPVARL